MMSWSERTKVTCSKNRLTSSVTRMIQSYRVCRFPSRIRVWVSCPLLWQQLSPAYQWWERSFPRPLAAAPHEWSRCRVQGQRCPQREWYPHHQRNLKENRKVAWKEGLNRIKIRQNINHTLVPKGSWNRLQPGSKKKKLELTGHVEDTIAGIDVGKKSISESLSGVGSLHQPSDVHNI